MNEGSPPSAEVLLIPQTLIRRDEDLKPPLGLQQQVTVLKIRPSQFECRGNFVERESVTQRRWRALIEENALGAAGSGDLDCQGRLGEFEDRQSLLAGHAGKPFEELVHRRAAFKILEERRNRHACSLEHPSPAYLAGHPLHCRTIFPIQHGSQTTLSPGHGVLLITRQRHLARHAPNGKRNPLRGFPF